MCASMCICTSMRTRSALYIRMSFFFVAKPDDWVDAFFLANHFAKFMTELVLLSKMLRYMRHELVS